MKRLSLLWLSILGLGAGCYGGERAVTGKCPAGEVCSPATPYGLQFVGNAVIDGLFDATGPAPTAIGGTQDVALSYSSNDGSFVPLDLPYEADDDGGAGVTIDHTAGSVVTVRGHGSRANYLRIVDTSTGELMDRKELTGAALDTIELVPGAFEVVPPSMPLAWGVGDQTIGVALSGQVQESTGPQTERLVDTSMQLVLDGSTRPTWDSLRVTAAPGTYAISATAGDKPAASLDLIVVDHADAVTVQANAPTTLVTNQPQTVCFTASSGARFIAGLTWSFSVVGHAQSGGTFGANCVDVEALDASGTLTIHASAGGQTGTVSLAIGAARETAPAPVRERMRPTAGERAAMY